MQVRSGQVRCNIIIDSENEEEEEDRIDFNIALSRNIIAIALLRELNILITSTIHLHVYSSVVPQLCDMAA